MLRKVRVYPKSIGNSKLAFVKVIKTHTQLGLKEAKEWCDQISLWSKFDKDCFELEIKTNVEDFKNDLNDLMQYSFDVTDKEEQRNLKLLSLGLGDINEKLEAVSDELASKLVYQTRKRNQDELYDVYYDFFYDFLIDLKDENLQELIEKKLKRLQNG